MSARHCPRGIAKPDVQQGVASPASAKRIEKSTDAEIIEALKNVINPAEVSKEIVILNTESGFIPDVVQVKKDEVYKIHIVNLNMKEKLMNRQI